MSSKKTTKTAKPATKAPVAKAVKAEKAAKPEIDVKELALPNGVEMTAQKTCITFVRGEKKAILKGRALELTSVLKELGDRVKVFTDAQIEKCHLGSVRGIIAGVEDTVDLNKILAKYFKQSSKKTTKTAKAPAADTTALATA
ncbi:MAG: hypothetical protein PHF86_05040 [Candidatus Nanoarchaeia archaeon]|nr:hypothetical protein [Candidatus Nanoarchaeia archaeon]